MNDPNESKNCLGIAGKNYEGHALIHFDTEQSQYDWQQVLKTALRRAKLEKPPKWLLSYNLTGLQADECRHLLEHAMRTAKKKFGGIFAVMIDGIADFVIDPNNPEECFPLVTKLHGLAIEYQTAIVNVIHMNPGSDVKARGHLGSQLERKSESNLTLEKDEDGITRLWATRQRGKMIAKEDAPAFEWSDSAKMHVLVESRRAIPSERRGKINFDDFRSCFENSASKAQSAQEICRKASVKTGTHGNSLLRQIYEWGKEGLVEVDSTNVNAPKYWLK